MELLSLWLNQTFFFTGGKGEFLPLILSTDLLLLILLLPLFTLFFLFVLSFLNTNFIYISALFSSCISFFLSLLLWFSMDEIKGGFQSTYTIFFVPSFNFALKLGVDGISIFFVLLTNIFIFLCILNLNVSVHKITEVILYEA